MCQETPPPSRAAATARTVAHRRHPGPLTSMPAFGSEPSLLPGPGPEPPWPPSHHCRRCRCHRYPDYHRGRPCHCPRHGTSGMIPVNRPVRTLPEGRVRASRLPARGVVAATVPAAVTGAATAIARPGAATAYTVAAAVPAVAFGSRRIHKPLHKCDLQSLESRRLSASEGTGPPSARKLAPT